MLALAHAGISEGALFYVKIFNVAPTTTPRIKVKLKLKLELELRPVVASTSISHSCVHESKIATRRLLVLNLSVLACVCVSTDSERVENTHIRKS